MCSAEVTHHDSRSCGGAFGSLIQSPRASRGGRPLGCDSGGAPEARLTPVQSQTGGPGTPCCCCPGPWHRLLLSVCWSGSHLLGSPAKSELRRNQTPVLGKGQSLGPVGCLAEGPVASEGGSQGCPAVCSQGHRQSHQKPNPRGASHPKGPTKTAMEGHGHRAWVTPPPALRTRYGHVGSRPTNLSPNFHLLCHPTCHWSVTYTDA